MALAFHIENFGCRAARADGEAVAERLRASGHREGESRSADVVVVNTCSVTAEADREARAYIRRTSRLNPEARIVVTGCYAQRAPDELAGLPGVAAVVGNSHKALTPDIVQTLASSRQGEPLSQEGLSLSRKDEHILYEDVSLTRRGATLDAPLLSHATSGALAPEVFSPSSPDFVDLRVLQTSHPAGAAPIFADDRFAHSFLEEAQVLPGAQTRPNLKIQDGCSNRCTFCVIPQTRGNSRSLSEENVLAQVRGFLKAGGLELVLSGINLGRWGRDLASGATLAQLVRRVLTETGLARLRLSSIEPMDWDAELIGLMRDFGGRRLARHAHLPLQSGSDAVLRRMHRRYRPWHYTEKVQALTVAAGPELTLGADVMAGFPGETDREFEETVQFIRQLPFGYLHLFPFSPRPGTPGWQLHRQMPVAAQAVEERMSELRRLAGEKAQKHRSSFIGKTLDCITLHTAAMLERRSCTAALSENFLPLEILEKNLPANQLMRVRVVGITPESSLSATRQT